MSTHHGFKRIAPANWQEPDLPILFPGMTAPLWVETALSVALSNKVPADVAALFEVARGCIVYGWFFYPLMRLGAEQCQRVLETAVRIRCSQCGIPTRRTTKRGRVLETSFAENIEALLVAGVITAEAKPRWDATRWLRNDASHPAQQTLDPPGVALATLQSTAGLLDGLYQST